jgi:hypothetical protein
MSGINWQIVELQAQREAHEYATKLGAVEGSEKYSERFNGYHAGRMACAAERESFRIMLAEKSRPVIKTDNILCSDVEIPMIPAPAQASVPALKEFI